VNPDQFPNQEIRVSETFLHDHEPLLIALGRAVLFAALETSGAVDFDVREALAALIRTQRTLESGLYYETRPENMVARSSCAAFRNRSPSFGGLKRNAANHQDPDSEVLVVLVFPAAAGESIAITGENAGRRLSTFCAGVSWVAREPMPRQLPR